ncbi:HAMP domain-containing protein [Halomonas sp. MCCC 1A11036]|uniref:HAMP domain-containing protein n=1 Tax=Billgrantia zhangzhouensis TaxID=2733481 RepID=A0ABS9AEE4_9GAMM|nr:HAMP domain-containing protein [Halomonas zhangzhouensis]
MKRAQNISLRHAGLAMLVLATLLILAFALLAWNVMQQSRRDLGALERLNVHQASSLNRLQVASLEGLNRMDRALERQLRPSLGDPIQALQDVEDELAELRDAHASFVAASADDATHADLRDEIDHHASELTQRMEEQLAAIQAGNRAGYREITLEAMVHSRALTEAARGFHQAADIQGVALLAHAERQAQRFGILLAAGLPAALAFLAWMAWFGQRQLLVPLRHLGEHFRRLADGDLTATIERRGRNEIGQLFVELGGMQGALVASVEQLHDNSRHVFDSAQRLSRGNGELAARTHQQSAALDQTSASLEALTESVGHTSEHAAHAAQLTADAVAQAQQGERVLGDFVATMGEIHSRSQRVDEVVGLIDSIAFQTNILALNASVEAARAGEQGRGFAVVASEVRTLASRSAEAARQIQTLLADSRGSVQRGHDLSDSASQGMHAIVAAIGEIDTLMSRIDTAAHTQRDGLDQLSHAMRELESVAQANARQVDAATRDATTLESAAERMREQAARFRTAEVPAALPVADATPAEPPGEELPPEAYWEPREVALPSEHTQHSVSLVK